MKYEDRIENFLDEVTGFRTFGCVRCVFCMSMLEVLLLVCVCVCLRR